MIAIKIVQSTPRAFYENLGKFIVTLDYLFGSRKRRAVSKNIEAITGETDGKVIRRLTYSLYINFALNIIDYCKFLKRDENAFRRTIDFTGIKETLTDLSLAKKGVIVIAAHLGNWEIAGFLVGFLGFKPHGIGLPQTDQKIEGLYQKMRENWNLTVHPFNGGALGVYKALKQNEIASIVSDRDINHDGAIVDFFGRKVRFPKGAATLAYRTGARSVFGYAIREKGLYRAILSPEIVIDRSKGEESFVSEYVQTFASLLESAVKKYPDQWFQFFDYFEEYK
ncbi:MAG: lysophospholipid acyltransferase family protein [Caldisericaceae bacterium]